MRTFAFALCLALCGAFVARAADTKPATVGSESDTRSFVIGLSPFLDSTAKDPVYRSLVRMIVEDLPLGSTLEVYDAYHLKSVTRLSLPAAKVFNSPKTRANQFAGAIGEIKRFLAGENAKPSAPGLEFEGAIRLPQFWDFLAENRPAQAGSSDVALLLIGSPLYQDASEKAFSMTGGYFPSDGHLHVSREVSVFGGTQAGTSAPGMLVSWVYFGEPWANDLHRERVERFWALYSERRGGRLVSFSTDLPTATSAFCSRAMGASAASKGWVADPRQTKPEMVRVSRNVPLVDWLTGDAVSETAPPPPAQMVGPMKIGIRWKEDIDLDLYAAPRHDAETLFFQHPRSAEGYYFKDQRSSPGREYEYIEFESPVDAREVRAYVNFYGGHCPGGAHGEVRIEFLNRIYTGVFEIVSSEGNQGRSGRAQANSWTEIPVRQILRIDRTEAASASR